MADIYKFNAQENHTPEGEVSYETFNNGWNIVRFIDKTAIVKDCEKTNINVPISKEVLSQFNTDQYEFLALRNSSGCSTILMVVNRSTNWIDEFYFTNETYKQQSLELVAAVISQNSWSMNYHWNNKFIISHKGKVYNVNALPDRLLVAGNIIIDNCSQVSLPNEFVISGNLSLSSTTFTKMPKYLWCVNLEIFGCFLPKIADRLKTNGELKISMSRFPELADFAEIHRDFSITDVQHDFKMPDTLRVVGDLNARTTLIDDFGKDTIILGDLNILSQTEKKPFALDISGRIIRNGDDIVIIDTDTTDNSGEQIMVRSPSGTPAKFYGEKTTGLYDCRIFDEERKTIHTLTPLRHSVVLS